jgi:hypothetical protein
MACSLEDRYQKFRSNLLRPSSEQKIERGNKWVPPKQSYETAQCDEQEDTSPI